MHSQSDIHIKLGPSLQLPGDDTMTVLWETDRPCIGSVACISPDDEEKIVISDDQTASTRHRVTITGLIPKTVYRYRVKAGNRVLHESSFRTLVRRSTYRVAIAGDIHAPREEFGYIVPMLQESDPDFMIFLGDFVYRSDENYWPAFFRMGRDLFDRVPLFPVVGDHDLGLRDKYGLFSRYFCTPNKNGRYSFCYARTVSNDVLLFFDSTRILGFYWQALRLYRYVKKQAKEGKLRYLFVFAHKGPISFKGERPGLYGIRTLFGMLKRYGVTAIFSGHDHHYVRGRSHGGIPLFVSGGAGGGRPYKINPDNIHARLSGSMEYGEVCRHFLVLDVSDDECSVTAVDETGRIVEKTRLSPL
ncbi:MAG: metallophosphoesterase family protein [Deltaproteobacteria bacterium]|nr:metallophosphoesterase family protein [Candidatus Zymogenaceae bacterium]